MDEGDRERCERLARAIGEWGAMPDFLHAVRERGVRGSSQTSVYRYVKAQIVPGIDFLVEAAGVLGVRRDWLLFGEGEQTEAEEMAREGMAKRAIALDERLWGSKHSPAISGLVLQAIQQLFLADPDGAVLQGPEFELLETLIVDLATEPLNRFRPADSNPDEVRAALMATLQGVVLSIPGRRRGRPLADIIGEGEGVDLMAFAARLSREPDGDTKRVLEDLDRYVDRLKRQTPSSTSPGESIIAEGGDEET